MSSTGTPSFRFHKIPTPKSEPYICIEGPDDRLWFCQSGSSKIGRLDLESGAIDEFALPETGEAFELANRFQWALAEHDADYAARHDGFVASSAAELDAMLERL